MPKAGVQRICTFRNDLSLMHALIAPLAAHQRVHGVSVLWHPCGGFSPHTATDAEDSTEDGNDERIWVEDVRRGPKVLYDVVMALAGS